MTQKNTALRNRTLDRDDDLRDVLDLLLESASARRMWLLFLDRRGRLADPILPMTGYPDDPGAVTAADDLGEVTHAQLLTQRIGLLLDQTENATAVLAWERPGSSVVGPDDSAWARAIVHAAHELEVPVRAQFLVHSRGVRQIHPDDYL